MTKKFFAIACLCLCLTVQIQAQTATTTRPNNYLGLTFGTGYFQDISLQLTDLDKQLVATSDPLVPSQLKANFTYFFTNHVGIRFTSGYVFARQLNRSNVDFSQIDSLDFRYEEKARFKLSGYPLEAALVLQTPLDAKENFMINFGIGTGYYTYNYESNGSIKEFRASDGKILRDEEYDVPTTTLTGWAQFIFIGATMRISKTMGASFELSKIGFSNMYLENDVVKRQVYEREIENQFIYGFEKDDHTTRQGFNDISLNFGLFWYL